MESVLEEINDWLCGLLIDGIMGSLEGVFDSMNTQVGEIAEDVGRTPAAFAPEIFSMIRKVSESVILPIAGLVLTFVACYELIQMIISLNNLAQLDTWIFLKWIIKTTLAILIVSNTWNITMAVFEISQSVVQKASGVLTEDTAVSDRMLLELKSSLETKKAGELIGIYCQSFLINIGMWIMSRLIFVIVYGRMIEIYLMTSLAPIPLATLTSREQSMIGQNYLRSLAALGFQGFLILICVAIYAVLIQGISFSSDITASIWGVLGYSILLCFSLFSTGSLAKSIFSAH